MTQYKIQFITPLFSRGAYDDLPEIRPASIRGQLHWWFRALGGSAADENAIFGSVHSKPIHASKVVVRVNNVCGQQGLVNTLPHKSGGQASPKMAFQPGTTCVLHFGFRLGGLDDRLKKAFDRTVETWLHLGTLGLRATRASGSFSWEPLTHGAVAMPQSLDEWRTRCTELLKNAPLKFYLTTESFDSAEKARSVVSDTIGGRGDKQGESSLARINYPLGRVFGGRKTSPLRFRIVPIAGRFHIAAVWDDRPLVTGNQSSDLASVVALLQQKRKEIGVLLKNFK
jgi:hypothetical protein